MTDKIQYCLNSNSANFFSCLKTISPFSTMETNNSNQELVTQNQPMNQSHANPKPRDNNVGVSRRRLLRRGCGGGRVAGSVVHCQVDRQRIAESIRILSLMPRRIFTEGNEAARQFIYDTLYRALGGRATVESVTIPIDDSARLSLKYDLPGINIGELHNVIARIPGREALGLRLIICAHFDSIGEGINNEFAPGADDNASGVAALLEIAMNLRNYQLPFDIELIAFDGEEYGQLGSKAYTAVLEQNDPSILGVINLDTLGGNPLTDRLVLGGKGISGRLMDILHQVNDSAGVVTDLINDPLAAMSSDQGQFYLKGIPSVMISENGGPGPAGSAYPGNLVAHTAADIMVPNMEAVAKATELTLRFIDLLAQGDNWRSSLAGVSLEPPVGKECQDINVVEGQSSQTINLKGKSFIFLGGAIPLANSTVISNLADRLVIFKRNGIYFKIDDCMPTPFGGSGVGLGPAIGIDSRVPLSPLPEEFELVLATVVAHELSHGFYDYSYTPYSEHPYTPTKEKYLNLYYAGRSLGTWDLLDDSVLLDYYPWAGHPKDAPDEGIASAGMAYTIFPATYRRIIALFALNPSAMEESLQNEPFRSESLNRVFRVIYSQTPDRAALRQNLIDIYTYIKENHANGIEFDTDFR
ncbi:MAG: M28 family metallopeptidase [Candidatus Margulisiibacteriota bacterium]